MFLLSIHIYASSILSVSMHATTEKKEIHAGKKRKE